MSGCEIYEPNSHETMLDFIDQIGNTCSSRTEIATLLSHFLGRQSFTNFYHFSTFYPKKLFEIIAKRPTLLK
jgi:hypothetical protein